MEFQIHGTIEQPDDNGVLAVLTFFKDNYAAEVQQISTVGTFSYREGEAYKTVRFGLAFADYTSTIDAVVAIRTAYGVTADIQMSG